MMTAEIKAPKQVKFQEQVLADTTAEGLLREVQSLALWLQKPQNLNTARGQQDSHTESAKGRQAIISLVDRGEAILKDLQEKIQNAGGDFERWESCITELFELGARIDKLMGVFHVLKEWVQNLKLKERVRNLESQLEEQPVENSKHHSKQEEGAEEQDNKDNKDNNASGVSPKDSNDSQLKASTEALISEISGAITDLHEVEKTYEKLENKTEIEGAEKHLIGGANPNRMNIGGANPNRMDIGEVLSKCQEIAAGGVSRGRMGKLNPMNQNQKMNQNQMNQNQMNHDQNLNNDLLADDAMSFGNADTESPDSQEMGMKNVSVSNLNGGSGANGETGGSSSAGLGKNGETVGHTNSDQEHLGHTNNNASLFSLSTFLGNHNLYSPPGLLKAVQELIKVEKNIKVNDVLRIRDEAKSFLKHCAEKLQLLIGQGDFDLIDSNEKVIAVKAKFDAIMISGANLTPDNVAVLLSEVHRAVEELHEFYMLNHNIKGSTIGRVFSEVEDEKRKLQETTKNLNCRQFRPMQRQQKFNLKQGRVEDFLENGRAWIANGASTYNAIDSMHSANGANFYHDPNDASTHHANGASISGLGYQREVISIKQTHVRKQRTQVQKHLPNRKSSGDSDPEAAVGKTRLTLVDSETGSPRFTSQRSDTRSVSSDTEIYRQKDVRFHEDVNDLSFQDIDHGDVAPGPHVYDQSINIFGLLDSDKNNGQYNNNNNRTIPTSSSFSENIRRFQARVSRLAAAFQVAGIVLGEEQGAAESAVDEEKMGMITTRWQEIREVIDGIWEEVVGWDVELDESIPIDVELDSGIDAGVNVNDDSNYSISNGKEMSMSTDGAVSENNKLDESKFGSTPQGPQPSSGVSGFEKFYDVLGKSKRKSSHGSVGSDKMRKEIKVTNSGRFLIKEIKETPIEESPIEETPIEGSRVESSKTGRDVLGGTNVPGGRNDPDMVVKSEPELVVSQPGIPMKYAPTATPDIILQTPEIMLTLDARKLSKLMLPVDFENTENGKIKNDEINDIDIIYERVEAKLEEFKVFWGRFPNHKNKKISNQIQQQNLRNHAKSTGPADVKQQKHLQLTGRDNARSVQNIETPSTVGNIEDPSTVRNIETSLESSTIALLKSEIAKKLDILSALAKFFEDHHLQTSREGRAFLDRREREDFSLGQDFSLVNGREKQTKRIDQTDSSTGTDVLRELLKNVNADYTTRVRIAVGIVGEVEPNSDEKKKTKLLLGAGRSSGESVEKEASCSPQISSKSGKQIEETQPVIEKSDKSESEKSDKSGDALSQSAAKLRVVDQTTSRKTKCVQSTYVEWASQPLGPQSEDYSTVSDADTHISLTPSRGPNDSSSVRDSSIRHRTMWERDGNFVTGTTPLVPEIHGRAYSSTSSSNSAKNKNGLHRAEANMVNYWLGEAGNANSSSLDAVKLAAADRYDYFLVKQISAGKLNTEQREHNGESNLNSSTHQDHNLQIQTLDQPLDQQTLTKKLQDKELEIGSLHAELHVLRNEKKRMESRGYLSVIPKKFQYSRTAERDINPESPLEWRKKGGKPY